MSSLSEWYKAYSGRAEIIVQTEEVAGKTYIQCLTELEFC